MGTMIKQVTKWLQRTVWPWSAIWRINNHLRLSQAQCDNLIKRDKAMVQSLAECQAQVAKRESLHEQQWLMQASVVSGVDFGYIQHQVDINQRAFNSELQCAKECYRQGYGYREFPNFLAIYEGRGGLLNPLLGLRQEKYWKG